MPPSKNKLDRQVLQYEEFPLVDISNPSLSGEHRNVPLQYDTKMEVKWTRDMLNLQYALENLFQLASAAK